MTGSCDQRHLGLGSSNAKMLTIDIEVNRTIFFNGHGLRTDKCLYENDGGVVTSSKMTHFFKQTKYGFETGHFETNTFAVSEVQTPAQQ